jgi:hypothetical protein
VVGVVLTNWKQANTNPDADVFDIDLDVGVVTNHPESSSSSDDSCRYAVGSGCGLL